MNDAKFVNFYNSYHSTIPARDHSDAKKIKELISNMVEESKDTHALTVKEVSYMSDKAFCSCGWESDGFWDGADYAVRQWMEHVYKDITENLL